MQITNVPIKIREGRRLRSCLGIKSIFSENPIDIQRMQISILRKATSIGFQPNLSHQLQYINTALLLTAITQSNIHICFININHGKSSNNIFDSMPSNPEISSEAKNQRKNSEGSNSLEDQHPNDQFSKEEQDLSSKKRERDWVEKDSRSKVVVTNRREKYIEFDPTAEGIFLYKPGVQLPSLFQFANQNIRVIIASEYIKKYNPEIHRRHIYGTDTYTSHSDCVCIGIHSGFLNLNAYNSKKFEGVELSFKVIKPKKNYTGSTKNGITSRSIKGYMGNSLRPDQVKPLTSLGDIESLEKYASNMHIPIGKNRQRPKPKNISNIIPIPETHIIFNMNNEPAYKYSICNLADKGFQKNEFITKKMDTHVLYLETSKGQKYELSKNMENGIEQSYQLARVKDPYNCDNIYFQNNAAPLQLGMVQIVFPALQWQQISWGNQSIKVKEKMIEDLLSFKYYSRSIK